MNSRERFEAEFAKSFRQGIYGLHRLPSGAYADNPAADHWETWQAAEAAAAKRCAEICRRMSDSSPDFARSDAMHSCQVSIEAEFGLKD